MLSEKIYSKKDFELYCESILQHVVGKRLSDLTEYDKYRVIAFLQKAVLMEKNIETEKKYQHSDVKKVYYLSLEFLMGRFLRNSLDNLDLEHTAKEALQRIHVKLEDAYEEEYDAGLGNGGLGRLAACFLDSMATMDIPGFGFGIRYEYGMFKQEIENGYQVEKPDNWLFKNNPWEVERVEDMVKIKFYGNTRQFTDSKGVYRVEWNDAEVVLAVPYLVYIPGYKTDTVNTLTLWSARSSDDFKLDYFNNGDYEKAVQGKAFDETISKVLYPNDNSTMGKELRLKQQYFFVSASLQTIIKNYTKKHGLDFSHFHEKVAIQLNDTHPSISIAELMRLFIDVHNIDWNDAWAIVTKTFAYTNHTLMPEALEKWNVSLFRNLLPRHLEIIFEINERFLSEVRAKFPGDNDKVRNMSIIEESDEKKVRMAYLAIVGSHSVNGVAKLHSELLKTGILKDFYKMWPEKFNNKTNGVTQRRWLKQSNKGLSDLITKTIGDNWIKNLSELKKLEKYTDDNAFCKNWNDIKFNNKKDFSTYLKKEFNIEVDPNTMFDIQVKRIHEYKRQLLNALGVIDRYFKIKNAPDKSLFVPRTVLIGGKAAPGYAMAKLIIKFINDIGSVINNDSETSNYLKLFFIPNYRVSLAERIFPATDLSEQISLAGTEASGTGNMKFALNGALTIGTMDGANIEMKDAIGEDNMFIFGLTKEEVAGLSANGYNPYDYYLWNEDMKRVLNSICDFSREGKDKFKPIFDSLLNFGDRYMLLADFESYCKAQAMVDETYKNRSLWIRKSILNVANMGYFSSDRTILEYAKEIWKVK